MEPPEIAIDRTVFASIRRSAAYRAVATAWTDPVLVACSGGVDSMALVALAALARDAGRLPGFIAAHIDHGARSGSDAEARVVAAVCTALDVPFTAATARAIPTSASSGPEAELRAMRYDALAACAGRLGLASVVTAHTEDDQVETVLLRLLSGAGTLAAAGMRDSQRLATGSGEIEVLRPLLGTRRHVLAEVLTRLDLPHIYDPTNADLGYRRNRVRQRVIPELERVDPGFRKALLRSVRHARNDAVVVDRLAVEASKQHVCGHAEGSISIDRDFLRGAHEAVSARAVRSVLMTLQPGDTRELTEERIIAVVEAAAGRTGALLELPYGVIARVEREVIRIERRERHGNG